MLVILRGAVSREGPMQLAGTIDAAGKIAQILRQAKNACPQDDSELFTFLVRR